VKICRKCIVEGLVQGVFYRASTAEQAKRVGLSGYVKNLENGTVEVLLCGEEKFVDQVASWLKQGPKYAEVSFVSCELLKYFDNQKFSIH